MSLILILSIAVATLVGYILASKWYDRDTKTEAKRKAWIKLSSILEAYGMKDLPAILVDLAVEDYSDAYKKAEFWVALMARDPNVVIQEFDKVYDRVSAVKIANPESRALLKQLIAEAEKTV